MTGNGNDPVSSGAPVSSDGSVTSDVTVAGSELVVSGITLCPGEGAGPPLFLSEPLSFWGGADRATGMIIDTHHPQHGAMLGGTVMMMDASRGSSSSSSVLAEQLRAGVGPAAIILTARDAIVSLGVLAAAELYGSTTPVVLLSAADATRLRNGLLPGPALPSPGPARMLVTAHADGSAAVVLQLDSLRKGRP